ncbi:MAG: 3,4-dihydroxy-2-butanone-4-phosphate synthase [Thermoplasmata archaeon]|jgi:3,4-dihydroxy 2-butanone 4-phosphate synthase
MALSPPEVISRPVVRAIEALADGRPLLIFDAEDREGEVDLVYLSESITPARVRELRREAGGVICAAIPEELARRVGLPFFTELLAEAQPRFPITGRLIERPRYDARSAFGLTVNHRGTFTGIPDRDRAQTIGAIGRWVARSTRTDDRAVAEEFAAEFSAPGHVPLLYAAEGLSRTRRGHTELSMALARMGGLSESTTVCEMLGEDDGPLPRGLARPYAERHDGVFIEGREIADAWGRWSE